MDVELLVAMMEVQKALACHRDNRQYIHPKHEPLCLEELKYLVVDPSVEKAKLTEQARPGSAGWTATAVVVFRVLSTK